MENFKKYFKYALIILFSLLWITHVSTLYGWFYLAGAMLLIPKIGEYLTAKFKILPYSKIGLVVLFVGFILNVATKDKQAPSVESSKSEDIQIAKADEGQKVPTKAKVENLFSAWDGSLRSLVNYTKRNMNDPDSFEHVETRYSVEGDKIFVAMEYRGKNGFGAKMKAYQYAFVDMEGNIISIENGK